MFIFGLLVILLTTLPTSAQELTWESVNGPYGGSITALYATPNGTLYVATANGGVFRSTNGGESWTVIGNDFAGISHAFAIIGNTLYLAIFGYNPEVKGVYRSEDEGRSWLPSGQGLPTSGAGRLVTLGTKLFAGSTQGVFRTVDGGKNWQAINAGLSDRHVLSMLVVGDILYVGTASGGVFRSENQGESWTQVNNGLPRAKHEWETPYWIPALAASGTMLYAGTREGVYRSENRGDSWEKVNNGLESHQVIALTTSGETIYAGTPLGGVFRSEDRGESWIPINSGLPSLQGRYPEVRHLAIAGTTLYASVGPDYHAFGIFRYNAGAKVWKHASVGLEPQRVRSFTTQDGTIYAGTASSGVFRSEDRGHHWTLVSNGLPSLGVWSLAVLGKTIYAGVYNVGVFHSDNKGNTWTSAGKQPWTDGPAPILTASEGKLYAIGNGVFRSDDGDGSWESLNEGLDRPNVRALLESDGNLYAGTTDGVFRLEKGEKRWLRPRQAFETQVLVALGSSLYAGTSSGVYRSIDEGGVWTFVNTGLTNLNIRSLIAYGSSLYAGTADGVFHSEDGGNSWTFAGLKGEQVEAFLVVDGTLYAGTEHGVFRTVLDKLPSYPRLFVLSPHPNEAISPGMVPLLAVHIENHKGRWQWRLDTPFPDSGSAGGILGPLDNKIILTGLKPGRMYTLYVTLVDDQGNMLRPPVIARLPFFVASETPGKSLKDTKIAFVSQRDGNKEIYVMNADGSNPVNLSHNPASDHSPVWSPDGIKIAFISNRDGSDALFVMNSDGSNIRKLTDDFGEVRQPKWSPDGTKIAFLYGPKGRYADEIQVVDVDGSNRLFLAKGTGFSWSPKEAKLAFVSGNVGAQGLYLIESDGSNEILLTQTSGGSLGDIISYLMPIWFPDATKLLFLEGRWSAHGDLVTRDVFLINPDGSEKRPLGLGSSGPLDFAPDGRKILFTTIPSSRVGALYPDRLFVTDADGSNRRSLDTSYPFLSNPSWSPDGMKIVAQLDQPGKPDLYIVNPDGTERIRLTDNGGTQPSWQPFPNSIVPRLPKIQIVSPAPDKTLPAEATMATLKVKIEGYAGPWQWRLDTSFPSSGPGDGMMVSSGNIATIPGLENGRTYTVYAAFVDADGNLLESAFRSSRTFSVAYPTPSPELARTKIAFVSSRDGNSEIYTINVDGTELRRLTNSPETDWHPSWSPDGRRLVFGSRRDGNWQIYVMNADGSNLKRLTHSDYRHELYPAWSPDGKKIAYTSSFENKTYIYVMNADGSEPTQLTDTGLDGSPSWSPDGTKIVFKSSRDAKGGLYIMNADGTQVRRLTDDGNDAFPRWSPRGNQIAFMSLAVDGGSWDIFMIDPEGRHRKRLTHTPSEDMHPAWSPDGAKMVFNSNRVNFGEIFIMNPDGTGLTPLTIGSFESMPAWSPIPPPVQRVEHTFPFGLSLFSPKFPPTVIYQDEKAIPVSDDSGVLMASQLIRLGATVCIRVRENVDAVIGHDGKLLFGRDFPIETGNTYIINMLTPTAITLEGPRPRAPRREDFWAPAAKIPTVWAFVIAGKIDHVSLLPSGTRLRIVKSRTEESFEVPFEADGRFITALVDMNQKEVIAEGDIFWIELVTAEGYVLRKSAERQVSREELSRAFTVVELKAQPQKTRLLQNYPNPFNPITWIPFELSELSEVRICIYNLRGELLRTLDLGHRQAGYYISPSAAAHWDGRNALGEAVASGVYFYELQAGNTRAMRRMVVQR